MGISIRKNKLRVVVRKRTADRKKSVYSCLFPCFAIAALLCVAQVQGSSLLIAFCLACFLALTAYSAMKGYSTPVLLFFLPWSPLLKLAPGGLSFYTFALIVVCLLGFFRKRFAINVYCVMFAIPIVMATLLSRIIDGLALSNPYILFVFLLILFPIVMGELRGKVDFAQLTIYFSLGIIAAALSAQQLVVYSRIARYIDVYVWNVVTRLSGYYKDANFYSAHISAALSAILLLLLRENNVWRRNLLVILAVILLYCGFLSASKSFILVIAMISLLWICKIMVMRGRLTTKAVTIIGVALVVCAIVVSGIFSEQWEIIVFRFQQSDNLSGLTTGRTEIWVSYLRTLVQNIKLMLLGKGYENAYVNDRASHNTIIQLIYQLGMLGSVFLLMWEYYFIHGVLKHYNLKIPALDVAILLTGVIVPWMGLDLLFFDEFFLMPLFVIAGVIYFSGQNNRLE